MDKASLITFSPFFEGISGFDYGIFNLPFAVPSLLGFTFSFFLTCILFIAALKRKDKRDFFNSVGFSFMGLTIFQLLLAFRSILSDLDFLFTIHSILNPIGILYGPALLYMVYCFTGKRYKPLLLYVTILFIIIIWIWWDSFSGLAFTGKWWKFEFGYNFIGGLSLIVFEIFNSISLLVGVFFTWKYYKENSNRDVFLFTLGFSLLAILMLLNLPIQFGFPIYSGGNFLLIPIVILAYSIFKPDFINLENFLYKKSGLFFILSGFICILFLILSILIFKVDPKQFGKYPSNLFSLIPLVSTFILFLLSIYIAGINPREQLNLYAAATLIIPGIFMINLCVHALGFSFLFTRRFEQITYLIFCFIPSVQMRFALRMIEAPYPKYIHAIDTISVLSSVLSLTPFLFNGFYLFPWGNVSEAGPVLTLFSLNGSWAIYTVIIAWFRKRETISKGGKLVTLSMILSGILLLFNVPSTHGYFMYPFGTLQFIPGILIAFAILHYGAISQIETALRISAKISRLAYIFVPVCILITFPSLGIYSLQEIIIHQIYANSALFLSFYMFTFVLTRPIAAQLDNQYQDLMNEKLKVEKTKNEVLRLNEITQRINANLSIVDILSTMFSYVKENFQIHDYRMYLIEKGKMVYLQEGREADFNLDGEKYLADNPIYLDKSGGFAYRVFKTKKYFYAYRIDKKFLTEFENRVVEYFNISSFITFPLILKGEVIAILMFNRMDNLPLLNQEEISSLQRFCDQIASTVQNSKLLATVEDTMIHAMKDQYLAEKAQREAEEAKRFAMQEKEKSESLILNILPAKIAEELKLKSEVEPIFYPSVTVMFTDFKGFTKAAEGMTPQELVQELDGCFTQFDEICKRYNLEKLKTIGDSYMCAGGIPDKNNTHYIDACLVALEIQSFMLQMKSIKEMLNLPFWELRLGMHTGPVVAGVVGKHKFAYDMWGDTVNTASRMESSGATGGINVSSCTYELAKYFFIFEFRGKLAAKNKADMDMYFLKRIRPDLTGDPEGRIPDARFMKLYNQLKEGKRFKFRNEARQ